MLNFAEAPPIPFLPLTKVAKKIQILALQEDRSFKAHFCPINGVEIGLLSFDFRILGQSFQRISPKGTDFYELFDDVDRFLWA